MRSRRSTSRGWVRLLRGPWPRPAWRDPSLLGLLLGVILAFSACSDDGSDASEAEADVSIDWVTTWEVLGGFGVDGDGDGLIDMPNRRRDPAPADFEVRLSSDGSIARRDGQIELATYLWIVERPDGTVERVVGETVTVTVPPGRSRVTVEATLGPPEARIDFGSAEFDVEPSEITVVSLGDSLASGEGNPERAKLRPGVVVGLYATWADSASAGRSEELLHQIAHRSSLAWTALTALTIERLDPHSRVAFLHLASSGATVQDGLLGPQRFPGGLESRIGLRDRAELDGLALSAPFAEASGQLDRMDSLLGGRHADVVLLSIGSNDIGFSCGVALLVGGKTQYDSPTRQRILEQGVQRGDWSLPDWSSELGEDFGNPCADGRTGMAKLIERDLPALAERLADSPAVDDQTEVAITSYPDFTKGTDGTCTEIGVDVAQDPRANRVMTQAEASYLRAKTGELNDALSDAARAAGWSWLGTIPDLFDGHGYCVKGPWSAELGAYRGANDVQSFWWPMTGNGITTRMERTPIGFWRTATESAHFQYGEAEKRCGGFLFVRKCGVLRVATSGMFHPNVLGHSVIANQASRLLVQRLQGNGRLDGSISMQTSVTVDDPMLRAYRLRER